MSKLRIAIQKSGRLSDDSLLLLARAGIKLRKRNNQLVCFCENYPLEILLVRDDDIPNLVADGICQYGIIGNNVLEELKLASSKSNIQDIQNCKSLNFGKCRLSIAVPSNSRIQSIESLKNLRIATSYPQILNQYLLKNNIAATVVSLSGSVEIAPRLGISDAICDLVSTGSTLEENNLTELAVVMRSNAVMIKNNQSITEQQYECADSLERRIDGVMQADESKYIMLHTPKEALANIVSLLPGIEKPTIVPLQGKSNMMVVHAVCKENIFWSTLEKIKAMGASSILVMPLEKIML